VTASKSGAAFTWRLALADFVAWIISVPLAVVLRFDYTLPWNFRETVLSAGFLAAIAYVALASSLRMYSGRYVTGTFDEVLGIVGVSSAVALVGSVVLIVRPGTLPRATFVVAGVLAGCAVLGLRLLLRRTRALRALGRDGSRTLIYGAGDAGSQLASLMQTDQSGRFIPIGFMDDDPAKRHLRRANLRVLGTGADLDRLIRGGSVDMLVVAIANVTSSRLQEIDRICSGNGVRVQVIPTTSEIIGGAIRLGDVSDLSEEEIMGRRPVATNEEQIGRFLAGKVVLVTGAGGSIGSELVRQIHRYSPGRVVLLDRDESALHETQLSIDGTGLLSSSDLVLCDIRDDGALGRILNEVRPDIVFHAAALKHLTFLERFPQEAWKTNVLGTANVLQAARGAGVPYFVNISTDKAADPCSVLGQSKYLTERLVADHVSERGAWVSVRFGNVLGSRGSVITTFRYQIAKGGPVTVTDPEVTRYFMTVREAVHLVLQAAVLGRNGETLILDMGAPVRISDIARYMVERSGRDIQITYSGLRPGEKLHEVLLGASEIARSPEHPLIAHTSVVPLNDTSLVAADDPRTAREFLTRLTLATACPVTPETGGRRL
jgi:FlaA1/EpsC-like NDP-sugar epimerase